MCDIFSNTTSQKNLHLGFSTRGIWKECYFNACFLMFPVVSRNIIWIHNEQIRSIAMHINLVLLVLCMQDRAGSHRCILKHALVQILPSAISVYLCKHVYTYIYFFFSSKILQEDKILCFLGPMSATIWSAADRIRKIILRGQCGMVRFHPIWN